MNDRVISISQSAKSMATTSTLISDCSNMNKRKSKGKRLSHDIHDINPNTSSSSDDQRNHSVSFPISPPTTASPTSPHHQITFQSMISNQYNNNTSWINNLLELDYQTQTLSVNPLLQRENIHIPSESTLPRQASLFDTKDQTTSIMDSDQVEMYRKSISQSLRHHQSQYTATIQSPVLSPAGEEQSLISSLGEELEKEFIQLTEKVGVDTAVFSTTSQTLFNCINLFIGVGLLSLPHTFKTGGWTVGVGCLLLGSVLSKYTTRLLIKSMDSTGAVTYSDLGEVLWGKWGRWLVTAILFGELFSCACAYIVLVGETLADLVPLELVQSWIPQANTGNLVDILKTFAFVAVMLPTSLVGNLKILSVGSLIGVLAFLTLAFVMVYDAFDKPSAPGSIWEPAETDLYPKTVKMWLMTPISLGLVMYNYSGGSIIPNLYRNMLEPEKIGKVLDWTFFIVTLWFLAISSLGYWMFGVDTMEQIIFNISNEPYYSKALTKIMMWLVVINPLLKFALMLNPVTKNIELALIRPIFINQSTMFSILSNEQTRRRNAYWYKAACITSRASIAIMAFLIAVFYPSFNDILALIGTFFSFSISVIFPCLIYMRVYSGRIMRHEYALIMLCFALSGFMVIFGPFWSQIVK